VPAPAAVFQWTRYEQCLRRLASSAGGDPDSGDSSAEDDDEEQEQEDREGGEDSWKQQRRWGWGAASALPLSADKGPPNREPLPIDAHREQILDKVRRERVVLIHGETGVLLLFL
jgi:HrpA-like RNA helicase